MFVDLNQPNSDGALMTQVPAQMQYLYGMKVLERLRYEPWRWNLRGTIVDQQDFHAQRAIFERVIQRREQEGNGAPVVKNRDEDNEPGCVILVHSAGEQIGRIQ